MHPLTGPTVAVAYHVPLLRIRLHPPKCVVVSHRLIPNVGQQTRQPVRPLAGLSLHFQTLIEANVLPQQLGVACEGVDNELLQVDHQYFLSLTLLTGYLVITDFLMIVDCTPSSSTKIVSLWGSSPISRYSFS